MKTLPVIGEVMVDPTAVLLGTNFMRFSSVYGIDGLARVTGDQLDLLAVAANRPGTGQFRRFIHKAIGEYKTVRLLHVDNPDLAEALRRYGFVEFVDAERSEIITGFEKRTHIPS